MRRNKAVGGLLAVALFATGCDGLLLGIASSGTVRVLARGGPALQRVADPDMAEAALPGSLATMEAVLVSQPDSDVLHVTLTQAWTSYGFGFLEDHMEQALADDNESRADHYRARASAAFWRARTLGFEMMSMWERDDGGAQGALRRGTQGWDRYLAHFEHHHAPQLFWTAYAWLRYINLNSNDVNAVADLPYASALARRVLELDRTYQNYAPLALNGGLLAAIPEPLGGNPRRAREIFDEVIRLTQRRNLMYLVQEARIVAVSLQDRALFRRLLEEVLNAGDVDPDNRLSNQLAKRRARRYLAQIDDLFLPDEGAARGHTGAPATP
jgi:hypothetical protein